MASTGVDTPMNDEGPAPTRRNSVRYARNATTLPNTARYASDSTYGTLASNDGRAPITTATAAAQSAPYAIPHAVPESMPTPARLLRTASALPIAAITVDASA